MLNEENIHVTENVCDGECMLTTFTQLYIAIYDCGKEKHLTCQAGFDFMNS